MTTKKVYLKDWAEELKELEDAILFNIRWEHGDSNKEKILEYFYNAEHYLIDILPKIKQFYYDIDDVLQDNYYNGRGLVSFNEIAIDAYRRAQNQIFNLEFNNVMFNVVCELFGELGINSGSDVILNILKNWRGNFSDLVKNFS